MLSNKLMFLQYIEYIDIGDTVQLADHQKGRGGGVMAYLVDIYQF
jgi:hypothetical protein